MFYTYTYNKKSNIYLNLIEAIFKNLFKIKIYDNTYTYIQIYTIYFQLYYV